MHHTQPLTPALFVSQRLLFVSAPLPWGREDISRWVAALGLLEVGCICRRFTTTFGRGKCRRVVDNQPLLLQTGSSKTVWETSSDLAPAGESLRRVMALRSPAWDSTETGNQLICFCLLCDVLYSFKPSSDRSFAYRFVTSVTNRVTDPDQRGDWF